MGPPPVFQGAVAFPLLVCVFGAYLVEGRGIHPCGADDTYRLVPAVQDNTVFPDLGQRIAVQPVQRSCAGGGGFYAGPGQLR